MSEQLLPTPEKVELLPEHGEQDHQPEWTKHEQAPENDPINRSVEALRRAAEAQARPSESVQQKAPAPTDSHTFGVHQQLKSEAYDRALQRMRHHLSAPERALSKVIHSPGMETATEISAKTIGRSFGLLLGAVFALLGSAFLLYSSKQNGFSYNYAVFLLLFLAGYILGVTLELATKPFRKKP
jgi:hypothetical protein